MKNRQEPFKFSINNIEVVNGSADFYDAPKNTRHTVRDVNISVPFLSNLPYDLSSYVEPFFAGNGQRHRDRVQGENPAVR